MPQVLCPDTRGFAYAVKARLSDFWLPLAAPEAVEFRERRGALWRDHVLRRRSGLPAALQEDHPWGFPGFFGVRRF